MSINNRYIDIHSHQGEGRWTVKNLFPWESGSIKPGFLYSIGLHPWYLDEMKNNQWIDEVQKYAGKKEVFAIGEAGLDRLTQFPFQDQVPVFLKQAEIAEIHGKPLIIHGVKAWNELAGLKKKVKPKTAWIVHGFRSKPEVGEMLISSGFYLSFGSAILNLKSNAARVLAGIPKDRFFLETDDGESAIAEIYHIASRIRSCSVEKLVLAMHKNFEKLTDRQHG